MFSYSIKRSEHFLTICFLWGWITRSKLFFKNWSQRTVRYLNVILSCYWFLERTWFICVWKRIHCFNLHTGESSHLSSFIIHWQFLFQNLINDFHHSDPFLLLMNQLHFLIFHTLDVEHLPFKHYIFKPIQQLKSFVSSLCWSISNSHLF